MSRIKTLFMFIILLGLSGCVTSNNYYVLSIAPQPTTHYVNKNRSILTKLQKGDCMVAICCNVNVMILLLLSSLMS